MVARLVMGKKRLKFPSDQREALGFPSLSRQAFVPGYRKQLYDTLF